MAEQIEYKWTVDDSDVIAAANRFAAQTEENIQLSRELEASQQEAYDSAVAEIRKATGETKKLAENQQKAADASAKQEKANNRLADSLKDTVRELQIGGKSLGEWVDGLQGTQNKLKGVTDGIGGTNKALRAFKIALASTGVGLIVIALGSLVALLTKTQRGIDFVNTVMAGLRATVDVLIDRLVRFGEGVVKLFQGDFRAAVDDFAGSVQGVTAEIIAETAAAAALERRAQSLRDRQRELNVEFAKSRARIEELRLAAEDETRSSAERQRLLQEAIDLENQLGAQRVELAQENVDIIKQQNALGESTAADLERQAEAEIALAEIREDIAGKQAADFAALQQLRREEAQRIAALRAEYQGFLDELNQRVTDARLTELTGIDRLVAEKELALQEVERFVDEVKAAAAAAGRDLPPEFSANVQALIQQIQTEFERAAAKERDSFGVIQPLDVLGGDTTDFERAGREAIQAFGDGAESEFSILERLNIALYNTFGVDAQGRQIIADAAGQAFGSFVDGLDAATQAQITQQDILLDAIQNRIDETQSLLDIELQRQAAGRANNVADIQAKLEKEYQAREEATNKRLELEKKAARQRLIVQQAEQISNYVLSVTRLVASESFKGLPGIFTAAAGVALLFSLIQQARAQSAQFEVPQFREGTPYLDGPGTGTSDSVPALLSRGERVVPAGLNMEMGGRSVSNEELVRLFNLGKAFEASTSAGPAFNMGPVVDKLLKEQRELLRMESGASLRAMERAYQQAADRSAEKMIAYWQTRPVEKVAPDGGRLIEWRDGNTIRRQTFRE